MAVSCQLPGTAVPPLSLTTFLISRRVAVSLMAVQRTNVPIGTVTPPFRPSEKPGTTTPAASTSTQLQLTVEPGMGTAPGATFCT